MFKLMSLRIKQKITKPERLNKNNWAMYLKDLSVLKKVKQKEDPAQLISCVLRLKHCQHHRYLFETAGSPPLCLWEGS